MCVSQLLANILHHCFIFKISDMPPGTDCPYPILILAFFDMIGPTAVSRHDTDLKQITEKQFMNYV